MYQNESVERKVKKILKVHVYVCSWGLGRLKDSGGPMKNPRHTLPSKLKFST